MKHLLQYLLAFTLSSVCAFSAQGQPPRPSKSALKSYSLVKVGDEPLCQAFIDLLKTKYAKQFPLGCAPFEKDIPGVTYPEWEELPMAQQEDFYFTDVNAPVFHDLFTPIKKLNESSLSPIFVQSPRKTDLCWREYKEKNHYLGKVPQYFKASVPVSKDLPPVTVITHFYPLDTCERDVRLFRAQKGDHPYFSNREFYVFNPSLNTLERNEGGSDFFCLKERLTLYFVLIFLLVFLCRFIVFTTRQEILEDIFVQ